MAHGRVLYDVCNDYSLERNCKESAYDLMENDLYSWHTVIINGVKLEIGTHKEYDEVHYAVSTDENLEGMII